MDSDVVKNFPTHLFVTGTDTGVGKTVVSAHLVLGLDASYWKPIQTGTSEGTDTAWIREVTELPAARFLAEQYLCTQPLSPHAAAQIDGIRIDLESIVTPEFSTNHLIVEGAGGVMVPLNESVFMRDLICKLGFPVLIVARSGLGTINHTLMTIHMLRDRRCEILGVVMNGPKNESNRLAIEKYGKVGVIAQIEPMDVLNASTLRQSFQSYFSSNLEIYNRA